MNMGGVGGKRGGRLMVVGMIDFERFKLTYEIWI